MNCLVFASLLFICGSDSARILGIFPTPSISHQVVYHALMRDLADRGHHLTILTTDLIKIQNPNVTQIDLHNSYEIFRKAFNFVDFKSSKKNELDLLKLFYGVMLDYLEDQLSHSDVKKLIQESHRHKFDAVIFEHINYTPYLAFTEIFDCPAIGIVSLDLMTVIHEWFGNEANPAVHSDIFFPFQHGTLSFLERWNSLKYYIQVKFLVEPQQEVKLERFKRKHFPNVKTSISELKNKIQLLMINTHPAMGFIRPLLPNTIQLGFMHIEPPKPLTESKLKTFLDNSENGVIYMSLGSNVQSKDLSQEILQIFLKVFASLKYDVVWKFEADKLPNKPSNVMISKWLPQSDLLAHPKIKLFITQGGQQSMEEAIDRTIPMIVLPFLADQDSNAKRMEQKGIGKHLELHSLTEKKLFGAISEMLKLKYKQNIEKLRELVNDQPMTSRDKAVWWTEYVIRHKEARHLEYPGRLVPFYQKYCLDFIGISILIAISFVKIFKILVSKLIDTNKTKRIKKE